MRMIRVRAHDPEPGLIREAADALRRGQLVAFPTETVYGLGALALEPAAVRRIYEAKGRPARNPLIVHVASVAMAQALTPEWTGAAARLASAFWPGPLTLVVRRTDAVPDEVTAGGDTVGIRIPAHPVALALIEAVGAPIAAPSANRSNEVSPTTADHVARGLGDAVDVVVDGGATTVGIESTVVDVSGSEPRVLRPGMITAAAIARVLQVPVHGGDASDALAVERPRAPGMLGRHYAPAARVVVFATEQRDAAAESARAAIAKGERVGAMTFTALQVDTVVEQLMPPQADAYARMLYATLHALDRAGCRLVLVEQPPSEAAWQGVADRLRRATLSP